MPGLGPCDQECEVCRAQMARGDDHQTGCPTQKPLTRLELVALAVEVERGWAELRRRWQGREYRRREYKPGSGSGGVTGAGI